MTTQSENSVLQVSSSPPAWPRTRSPATFSFPGWEWKKHNWHVIMSENRGETSQTQSQGTSTSDQPDLQPSPLILGLCDPSQQAGSYYHLAHFTAEQMEAQNPVCDFGHLAAHSACKRLHRAMGHSAENIKARPLSGAFVVAILTV